MAKILVVDDDAELVESVKTVLESDGHAVVSASDGESGHAKAVAERPDLIVLDVMMKHDREGFEVAQRLKADPQTAAIPVVLLTGIRKAKHLPFRFEPDEDWLPVRAVLEKPVPADALLRSVREALAGRSPS
jgi:CheY-like chemotaxis protein